MANNQKTISTLCNETSKSVQVMEWKAAVPQAKCMLLLTDYFQVKEKLSDAAQTLKVIFRNTASPRLF